MAKNQNHKKLVLQLEGLQNVDFSLKTHYLIYKIENTINGKHYIGQHQTDDVFDDYKGSGTYLHRAYEKYGIENFKKTILYDFDNFNDMNKKEKELVPLSSCTYNNSMSYNLKEGGSNGSLSEESQKLRVISFKKTIANWTKEQKEAFSKKCSEHSSGKNNPMYGKDWREGKTEEELKQHSFKIHMSHMKRTPEQKAADKKKEFETKANRPQYLKDITSQKCSKHSKELWNNPTTRQKILDSRKKSPEEQKILNQRRSDTVKKFWENNAELKKQLSEKYSGNKNPMFGKRKMHLKTDKTITQLVKPEDFQKFLDAGYVFNRKNKKVNNK